MNDDDSELWYKLWWSEKYNRPLKDPILLSYTIEELIYEKACFDAKDKAINYVKKQQEEIKEAQEDIETEEFAKQLGFDFEDSEEVSYLSKKSNPEDKSVEEDEEDEAWMRKIASEEGVEFPEEMAIKF